MTKDEEWQHDYRLLQEAWASSDAVLITGAILRAEPDLICTPTYITFVGVILYNCHSDGDLKGQVPLQVIVTKSGQIPLEHPILQHPCLIMMPDETAMHFRQLKSQLIDRSNVEVIGFGGDWKLAMKHLEHRGIQKLNVCAGGHVFTQLLHAKLVHELRYTLSGSMFGGHIVRPCLFPVHASHRYSETDAPHFKFTQVRQLSDHLVYMVSDIEYRH